MEIRIVSLPTIETFNAYVQRISQGIAILDAYFEKSYISSDWRCYLQGKVIDLYNPFQDVLGLLFVSYTRGLVMLQDVGFKASDSYSCGFDAADIFEADDLSLLWDIMVNVDLVKEGVKHA